MSESNKRLGKGAREDLEAARDLAKSASKKFSKIGDKYGEKLADDAADAADKGVSHIKKCMEERK